MIRLLVLDRDPIYRSLLMATMVCQRLIPFASEGLKQCVQEINNYPIEALVFDFESLGENPFNACRDLSQAYPTLPLLLLQPGKAAAQLSAFAQKQGIRAILRRDSQDLEATVLDLMVHLALTPSRPPLTPSLLRGPHTPLSALKDLCATKTAYHQEKAREYKQKIKDLKIKVQANESERQILYSITQVTGRDRELKHNPIEILDREHQELTEETAYLQQHLSHTARLADRYAALMIEIHVALGTIKRSLPQKQAQTAQMLEVELFLQVQNLERTSPI